MHVLAVSTSCSRLQKVCSGRPGLLPMGGGGKGKGKGKEAEGGQQGHPEASRPGPYWPGGGSFKGKKGRSGKGEAAPPWPWQSWWGSEWSAADTGRGATEGQWTRGKGKGPRGPAMPKPGAAPPPDESAGGKAAPPPAPRWEQQRAAAAASEGQPDTALPWFYRQTGELLRVPYPYNLKDGWPTDGPLSFKALAASAKECEVKIHIRGRGPAHTHVVLTVSGPVDSTRAWYAQVRQSTRLHLPDGKRPRGARKAWVMPIVDGQLGPLVPPEEEQGASDESDASDSNVVLRARERRLLRNVSPKRARACQRAVLTRKREAAPSLASATPPSSDDSDDEEAAPSSSASQPSTGMHVDASSSKDVLMAEAAPAMDPEPARLPRELQKLYDVLLNAMQAAPPSSLVVFVPFPFSQNANKKQTHAPMSSCCFGNSQGCLLE